MQTSELSFTERLERWMRFIYRGPDVFGAIFSLVLVGALHYYVGVWWSFEVQLVGFAAMVLAGVALALVVILRSVVPPMSHWITRELE